MCCATITKVHNNFQWCYTACPTCSKKLKGNEVTNICSSCNNSFEEPTLRYILQLQIQDNTGELQVTAFGSDVTELLSIPAHDMIRIQAEQGNDAVTARLNAIVHKQYLFLLKITEYNIRFPAKPLTVAAIFDPEVDQEKKIRTEGETSK